MSQKSSTKEHIASYNEKQPVIDDFSLKNTQHGDLPKSLNPTEDPKFICEVCFKEFA